MTLFQLNRLVRRQPVEATIISDGCRDYVVELTTQRGAGLLTDRKGRRRTFASLAAAKRAVRKAHRIHLAVRIAADEASAGGSEPQASFARMQLSGAPAA